MEDLAIHAKGLGKRYRLGEREPYLALRDILANAFRAKKKPSDEDHFWAIKEADFKIKPGEVVALIGRNGSGKSTLLKLLSRITEPTEGEAVVRGRVGSLLEVGTGFHAELTGRENIYFNGSILGMSKAEMDARFDEIVAFAEVERFLDTPVKRWSSGMQVRLGFAIAAHLEPEILLVDEVLAVGDARFQRKCLNKLGEGAATGRTVIFVSHSMPSVLRLCSRAILLDKGRIVADGPAGEVVAQYLRSDTGSASERSWPEAASAPGDDVVRLRHVRVVSSSGKLADVLPNDEEVGIEIAYEVLQPEFTLIPHVRVSNQDGVVLFQAHEWDARPRRKGTFVSTSWLPAKIFAEGTFYVSIGIETPRLIAKRVQEPDLVMFQITESAEAAKRGEIIGGEIPGVIRPDVRWDTRAASPKGGL